MTFLEMCQKMIRDLGTQNTITTVVSQTGMNKKMVDWIADADEEVQTLWSDWDFLWSQYAVNTVADTRQSDKPSDIGEWDMSSFYLDYTTDDYTLLVEKDYILWRQADRQGTQTTGTPTDFIITPSQNVYLHPIPDAVYALTADYWKVPTRMTLDASTSSIPARFQRIIIARAEIYYAQHEELASVYELATAEYNDLLKRLEASQLPGKNKVERRGRIHDVPLQIRNI